MVLTNPYDKLGRLLVRGYPDGGMEKLAYGTRGVSLYTNQLGKITQLGYDALLRKNAETNANTEITLFKYDGAGNLTNLVDGKSQSTTWKFDLHGRMTNKVDPLGTNAFIHAYDANGRLTNIADSVGTTVWSYANNWPTIGLLPRTGLGTVTG